MTDLYGVPLFIDEELTSRYLICSGQGDCEIRGLHVHVRDEEALSDLRAVLS